MKRQVPRGIPGKFPAIRHRHHALIIEMTPVGITTAPARGGRRRAGRITRKPFFYDVIVELLGPEQPRQSLALNSLVFER